MKIARTAFLKNMNKKAWAPTSRLRSFFFTIGAVHCVTHMNHNKQGKTQSHKSYKIQAPGSGRPLTKMEPDEARLTLNKNYLEGGELLEAIQRASKLMK